MLDSCFYHIMAPEVAQKIGRVGVLYGGTSDEREVSLWGGEAVFNALQKVGIDTQLIDVGADFLNAVIDASFDYAFIVLHGRGGEDGSVQAILDWAKIPYTGSGVSASAIAMDKLLTKQLWQAVGLPVLPQIVLQDGFDVDAVIAEVGLPMAVKPALGGSSNGITKVEVREQLAPAYQKACQYDTLIMAETWIDGDEFTGAIIGESVLPLIRIQVNEGIYDFEKKYITGADGYLCPCGLPKEKEKALQQLMWSAARSVGAEDWCRVDVMTDSKGVAWLIEINTIPGMTTNSLVPKASQQAGLSFEETVLTILKASWERRYA